MTLCIENRALEVVCDSSDVNEQTKAGIPRLPLTNATFFVQHCGASCAFAPSDAKETSRHPDVVSSSFGRVELILMKEDLSSEFE